MATPTRSAESVSTALYLNVFCTACECVLFSLAGCRSDNECALTEACFDRECQDPCLYQQCGQNAVCEPRNHRAVCSCIENHLGNPYDYCRPYECLRDPDCPDTKRCENEKCVDPCKCARYADCDARNHRGYCTCIPDYTGDPYGVACTPSEFYQCFFRTPRSCLF